MAQARAAGAGRVAGDGSLVLGLGRRARLDRSMGAERRRTRLAHDVCAARFRRRRVGAASLTGAEVTIEGSAALCVVVRAAARNALRSSPASPRQSVTA